MIRTVEVVYDARDVKGIEAFKSDPDTYLKQADDDSDELAREPVRVSGR
jgi:hypothetical protein